jgi:hypothetical protein
MLNLINDRLERFLQFFRVFQNTFKLITPSWKVSAEIPDEIEIIFSAHWARIVIEKDP